MLEFYRQVASRLHAWRYRLLLLSFASFFLGIALAVYLNLSVLLAVLLPIWWWSFGLWYLVLVFHPQHGILALEGGLYAPGSSLGKFVAWGQALLITVFFLGVPLAILGFMVFGWLYS